MKVQYPAARLTKREQRIIELALSGLSNNELTRRLELTEVTAKAYLDTIYSRIVIANRTALATWRTQPVRGTYSTAVVDDSEAANL